MPEEYPFNKAVSLDVFIVKDALNKKYKVMSVLDLSALFHAAVIVGEGGGPPSSGDMGKAMQMIWFSWAGPPESIVLDRGLENRGQLQKLMTAHGVQLRYIGVESPWQLGRGERHGGLLKEVIKAVVTSRRLRGRQNMEFVVTESVGIKNHRVNHNGFSPSQWVLGRNPPDLESLTALLPEAKLGVHQDILDGETSFAQQMMVRGAAKEAFSRVDSSQRTRAAMLRKSVPGRGPFHMGDLVCFHRRQGSKAGWKWFGPARVIGQEGKNTLWVCHGGIPMTVSAEQCRHATGTEMMAKRMLELRPSRKRGREDMAPDVDDAGETNDDPFLDDLIGVGTVAENQQKASRLCRHHTAGLERARGLERTGDTRTSVHVQQPRLGGPVPDMPDVPGSSVGSPSMSAGEPEQELVPPSRDTSGQPDLLQPSQSSTSNGPNTSRAPEPLRPLQQALRISPDAVDGHPRNRHHSRSPPRAMMTISENSEVGKCFQDIAYEVNYLQAVMQQAVVADLIACNNLLSYVKKTPDRGLFYAYNAFDEQDQVIYSITDASHAAGFDVSTNGTPMGSRSQSGPLLETGQGTIHIIEYHSCVLKRVCRSTLQAETQSLIAGYEEGQHLRALMWGMNNDFRDKDLISAMDQMTLAMLTDCRSLEQHLRQPGLSTVADKRLAIDLSSMRQLIWRKKGELVGDPLLTDEPPDDATTVVKWIDTSTMLSDGLTKKMKSYQIDQAMLKGTLEVSFQKVLSSKAAEAKEKIGDDARVIQTCAVDLSR